MLGSLTVQSRNRPITLITHLAVYVNAWLKESIMGDVSQFESRTCGFHRFCNERTDRIPSIVLTNEMVPSPLCLLYVFERGFL